MSIRKLITIVVLVALGVALVVCLRVLWTMDEAAPFAVTSTGPLDIRLLGIRPDAGDNLYDPNGRKVGETLGIARGDRARWLESEYRRDFVFQLPETNEPPLFTPFIRICVSDRQIPLGAWTGTRLMVHEGKRLLHLAATFPRTYKRWIFGGLMRRDVPFDAIDVTLSYFHGPASKPKAAFNGPFKVGQKLTDATGRYDLVFKAPANKGSTRYSSFELSTKQRISMNTPVLLYDKAGKRYLANRGSASVTPRGANLKYSTRTLGLNQIARITFGETPFEMTFANIRLDLPNSQVRTHADYLDKIAERLGRKMAPKDIADYRFATPAEAVEVIDVVRGTNILRAAEAILHGTGGQKRLDPKTLTAEQIARIEKALHRWLTAMDPKIRSLAVSIGLHCELPGFIEPALELLEYPAIWDDYSTREIRTRAAYAIESHKDKLSDEAFERITRVLLESDSRDMLQSLKSCLRWPQSEARIKSLRQLAQDDRPWLWWDAMDSLASWGQFEGKADSLPHKLKLRLLLVRSDTAFSDAETITREAHTLLGGLLTHQLYKLDSATFGNILRKVVGKLDHDKATASMIGFLSAIEDHRRTDYIIDRIVKYINLWHGSNIGKLGTDTSKMTSDPRKYDWRAITADVIEWYDSVHGAADANLAE